MSVNNDVNSLQYIPNAISDQRDVAQRQKRVLGVAKRPREISSDQARRQKAYFFRKMENIRKT